MARCYSGSRDQVEIDQKREYVSVCITVNGKAAFSSLQTIYSNNNSRHVKVELKLALLLIQYRSVKS